MAFPHATLDNASKSARPGNERRQRQPVTAHALHNTTLLGCECVCASRVYGARVGVRSGPADANRAHACGDAQNAQAGPHAWDPARVVRASRTRGMFVCRVLVAR
eukprot:7018272-Prymnesium_polylepis.1